MNTVSFPFTLISTFCPYCYALSIHPRIFIPREKLSELISIPAAKASGAERFITQFDHHQCDPIHLQWPDFQADNYSIRHQYHDKPSLSSASPLVWAISGTGASPPDSQRLGTQHPAEIAVTSR